MEIKYLDMVSQEKSIVGSTKRQLGGQSSQRDVFVLITDDQPTMDVRLQAWHKENNSE